LNVHWVNDVSQTEIHTSEPLVPGPSAFEAELAKEKLKKNKSPGIQQIPAELVKAGGRAYHSEIHKLINSVWNKESYLRNGRSRSLYLSIRRVIKQTVVIIDAYHFYQLRTKFLSIILLSRLTPHAEEILWIINTVSDSTGQLLLTHSVLVKYLRKNGNTVKQCISYV